MSIIINYFYLVFYIWCMYSNHFYLSMNYLNLVIYNFNLGSIILRRLKSLKIYNI